MSAASDLEADVVIVGASVAGTRCALSLRDHGFAGSIVLIDSEADPLYDKPQLSKKLDPRHVLDRLADDRDLLDRGIHLLAGTTAHALDLEDRSVVTSAGRVRFDQVVIATGSRPRQLSEILPPRAGYLRSRRDWERISQAVRPHAHLLVIGGGFLGLEAASAATSLGMSAEIIDVAPRLLTRGVPRVAAELIAARHLAAGIELRLGRSTTPLTGDDESVETAGSSGDYALVSIGAVPHVDWLNGSGLRLDDGVVCDANLVAAPGVWVIGDCARWLNIRYGELQRHEHWTTASRHAAHVARSITSGTPSPMAEVPYVWSDQYNWKIQSVGVPGTQETHFVQGESHVVLCTDDDTVTGIVTINAEAACARARMMLQSENPSVDVLTARLRLHDYAGGH